MKYVFTYAYYTPWQQRLVVARSRAREASQPRTRRRSFLGSQSPQQQSEWVR